MYIEKANLDEYAIHGTTEDVESIYEALVFMHNTEKDRIRKKQLRKQIIEIETQIPKIEF